MNLKVLALVSGVLKWALGRSLDVPWDWSDYSWQQNELSPFYSAEVITPDQAYNMN